MTEQRSSSFATIEHLNSVNITHEEFERVVKEAERRREAGTDEDGGGMYMIASLFRGQPHKAAAIYFRMTALAKVLKNQQAPGWTLPPDSDGAIPTNQALLDAAVVCPLVETNGDIGFDPDFLRQKALELAEPEGRG